MKKVIASFIFSSALSAQPIIQPFKDIKYVPMPPMPATPLGILLTVKADQDRQDLIPTLKGIGERMCEFENRMSRDRVRMTYVTGVIGQGPRLDATHKNLELIPGHGSSFPVIGNAISAKHELGHEFGMGHANLCIYDTQTTISQQKHEHDFTDPMTISPGVPAWNAPHLHRLEWYTATEEAYAVDGGQYILRTINDGNKDFESLKTLYYEVPNSTPLRAVWFAYVEVTGKGWDAPQGMPGTAVAIYEAIGNETYLGGLIGLKPSTHVRSGLILTLTNPTKTQVTVDIKIDPTWVYQSGGQTCQTKP